MKKERRRWSARDFRKYEEGPYQWALCDEEVEFVRGFNDSRGLARRIARLLNEEEGRKP